jgi:ABC-type Co2+ transport system permease subunit
MSGIDLGEFIKRIIKYLVEGLIVAIAAYAIPKKSFLNIEEIAIIGLTAAATFAVLDVFLPAVGVSAKQGLGFAIGTGLTGGLKIM